MECEKGAMSYSQPKEFIVSPINSLGSGDTLFQATVGIQTQKLPFSSSPVQIFRQRYWYRPPQKKLSSVVNNYDAGKIFLAKETKKTIHLSLEDLSDDRRHSKDDDHRRSSDGVVKKIKNSVSGEDNVTKNISKEKAQAARRIYEALMLNAWRRRKEDGEELTKMIHNLTTELDSYKMKLQFLKDILKKETKRSGLAMKKISKLKSTIQDYETIIEAMKKEKERMVFEFEDVVSHERILRSNTKNELMQAKMEQAALEEQLAKEREKLNKLRGEMENALDKLEELEESQVTKNKWIERLNDTNQKEKSGLMDEIKGLIRTTEELEKANKALDEVISKGKDEAQVNEEHVLALEKELKRKEKQHEIEMTNAQTLLADILQERRQLESISDNKENEFVVLAKNILSGVGRIPLALFHRITYAFWPFECYDSVQRNSSIH